MKIYLLISALALFPSITLGQLFSDTVFHYHFDETTGTTAVDSSGYGHNATYGAGVTKGLPAPLPGLGTSVHPASNGRITFTDTSTDPDKGKESFLYHLPTQGLSFEAWVRLDAGGVPAGTSILFAIQPVGVVARDLSLTILGTDNAFHPGALSIGDNAVVNRAYVQGGLTWVPETWYHIGITIENHGDGTTTYNIYRNTTGDSINTSTPLTLATGPTANLSPVLHDSDARRHLDIGNYYGNSGNSFFPGQIDEVIFRSIPEPSILLLWGLGASVLAFRKRF